jgi:transcriptional regulator with GAF, ATPase, and Fis domain
MNKLNNLNNFNDDFFRLSLKFTEPFALCEELTRYIKQRFKADRVMIITFDEQDKTPLVRFKSTDLENDTASMWIVDKSVADGGKAIFLPNAAKEPDCSDSIAGYDFISVISVPLKIGDNVLGVLYMDKSSDNESFHPAHFEEIKYISDSILQILVKQDEITKLRVESKINSMDYFVGNSKAMKEVYKQINLVAKTDTNVYIYGESGTGKELVARALHDLSSRRNQKFIPVNCAAIPSQTAESELFGHIKGAFTGAVENKVGLFMEADKGTLFIDEIGDLSLAIQAKILRVLEDRKIKQMGSNKEVEFDARLIFAGSSDLEDMIKKDTFRKELFYRLNVFKITVPPLRQRKEAIPALVYHFLEMFCIKHKKPALSITANAMNALTTYDWPGNVRELKNAIERIVLVHQENHPITINEINKLFSNEQDSDTSYIEKSLDDMIYDLVRTVYNQSNRNISLTARLLKTTRQRVNRILGDKK